MGLLLDTHTFLWWLEGNPRLSRKARDAIGKATVPVYVSAASAWEIATKFRLGKLPGAAILVNDIPDHVASQEFHALSISLVHARRAGALIGSHRDPFDRMLIAQALSENLALVTNEKLFDHYGVHRVW